MKVKFNSKSYFHNWVEEDEETGELNEELVKVVDNGEIVAEVIEERKTRYLLLLPDGNRVFKRKNQVEVI